MKIPLETLSRDELCQIVESIWSEACDLRRYSHLLMCDLDRSLDPKRGRLDADRDVVTLMFETEAVDISQWLAGEIWGRSKAISERLEQLVFTEAS